jgi:hypothetical protein
LDPIDQGTGVAAIGPDFGQAAIPVQDPLQQSLGAVPILLIGRTDIDAQQECYTCDPILLKAALTPAP